MIYQVLERADAGQFDAEAILVAEKFSWGAALLPPVWALMHNMWRELALIALSILALVLLDFVIGDDAAFWLYLIGAIWLGFEAPRLRISALKRQGYQARTELVAERLDMAELAYARFGLAPR